MYKRRKGKLGARRREKGKQKVRRMGLTMSMVMEMLPAMEVKTKSYSQLMSSLENQLRMESVNMSWNSHCAELQIHRSSLQRNEDSSSTGARPDAVAAPVTPEKSF